MSDPIKGFMFNGLLAKHAVKDMQTAGLVHRPEVGDDQRKEADLFAPVQELIRGNSLQMQYAFRLLFVLENTVRELITSRFFDADGTSWFDTRASAQMKSKVNGRRETEDKNQWHTGRNQEPIYYLDFGDLAKLIINNWTVFEDLLPSQAWVQGRLEDAERSRNVIAHTNVLSAEEVSRLEMYLRDWIRQTG